MKTQEFPKEDDIVITNIQTVYSQNSGMINEAETLKIFIESQGAGLYFVIKTKRWSFDSVDEIIKILEDFKTKANLKA